LGDGTAIHSWVFQLEIRADGTASMHSSVYYDFMINTGSNSPVSAPGRAGRTGSSSLRRSPDCCFRSALTQIHSCQERIFRCCNTSERPTCFRWTTPTP
jgi:hypothetical protein